MVIRISQDKVLERSTCHNKFSDEATDRKDTVLSLRPNAGGTQGLVTRIDSKSIKLAVCSHIEDWHFRVPFLQRRCLDNHIDDNFLQIGDSKFFSHVGSVLATLTSLFFDLFLTTDLLQFHVFTALHLASDGLGVGFTSSFDDGVEHIVDLVVSSLIEHLVDQDLLLQLGKQISSHLEGLLGSKKSLVFQLFHLVALQEFQIL